MSLNSAHPTRAARDAQREAGPPARIAAPHHAASPHALASGSDGTSPAAVRGRPARADRLNAPASRGGPWRARSRSAPGERQYAPRGRCAFAYTAGQPTATADDALDQSVVRRLAVAHHRHVSGAHRQSAREPKRKRGRHQIPYPRDGDGLCQVDAPGKAYLYDPSHANKRPTDSPTR